MIKPSAASSSITTQFFPFPHLLVFHFHKHILSLSKPLSLSSTFSTAPRNRLLLHYSEACAAKLCSWLSAWVENQWLLLLQAAEFQDLLFLRTCLLYLLFLPSTETEQWTVQRKRSILCQRDPNICIHALLTWRRRKRIKCRVGKGVLN